MQEQTNDNFEKRALMNNAFELAEHHRASLATHSSISDEIIEKRGYRTVETKAELKSKGFSLYQCSVPGLLIPVLGLSGEIVQYQYRPDEPRIKDGKPVKYETPSKSSMVLDFPPQILDNLRDPGVPLFITEGIKKGDSLASRELCVVCLLGVWNWKGKNEFGGRTTLSEWDQIALNGRQVYVVFDSDSALNPQVHNAMIRLGNFIERKHNVRNG
jgi:hypothetical protein